MGGGFAATAGLASAAGASAGASVGGAGVGAAASSARTTTFLLLLLLLFTLWKLMKFTRDEDELVPAATHGVSMNLDAAEVILVVAMYGSTCALL